VEVKIYSLFRWGGGWLTPWPCRFTPGIEPVPIIQEVGWAPGPVWTGSENLAPKGIISPDRPARSESLHRLRYPGPVAPIIWEICDPWYTWQRIVCNFIFRNFRPLIHLAANCLQFYFSELRPLIRLAANCLQFFFSELPTPDSLGSELSAILFFGTSDPWYTWQRIVCNFFRDFRPLIHLAANCMQFYFRNFRPLIHLAANCMQFYFRNFRPLIHLAANCLQFYFRNFRPLIHLAAKCLQFYFSDLRTPDSPGSELSAIFFVTSEPWYKWQQTVCSFIFRNFRWIKLREWTICVCRV